MNIEQLAQEVWPGKVIETEQLRQELQLFHDLAIKQEHKRLLEGSGEPVAFMYPDDHERMTTTETFCTVYSVKVGSPTQGLSTVECYTAYQMAAAVLRSRVPLTDAQIKDVYFACRADYVDFARAIEAAHGIKEQP